MTVSLYVYQFGRTSTVPSISPACLKVETWLKLNGIKYEVSKIILTHGGIIRSFQQFFVSLWPLPPSRGCHCVGSGAAMAVAMAAGYCGFLSGSLSLALRRRHRRP